MAGEATAAAEVRIFQCPNCKEYINTSMTQCRFCNAAVDYNTAMVGSVVTDQTNSACNDASYLKIVARVTATVYLLSWVPFAGGWFGVAFLIMMVVVPIMGIRWWAKYGAITTPDPDYKTARKSVVVAMLIWAALLVVWLVISVIYAVIVISLSHGIR